jgi:hypothetical protein
VYLPNFLHHEDAQIVQAECRKMRWAPEPALGQPGGGGGLTRWVDTRLGRTRKGSGRLCGTAVGAAPSTTAVWLRQRNAASE